MTFLERKIHGQIKMMEKYTITRDDDDDDELDGSGSGSGSGDKNGNQLLYLLGLKGQLGIIIDSNGKKNCKILNTIVTRL